MESPNIGDEMLQSKCFSRRFFWGVVEDSFAFPGIARGFFEFLGIAKDFWEFLAIAEVARRYRMKLARIFSRFFHKARIFALPDICNLYGSERHLSLFLAFLKNFSFL